MKLFVHMFLLFWNEKYLYVCKGFERKKGEDVDIDFGCLVEDDVFDRERVSGCEMRNELWKWDNKCGQ
jgi:hypothetical protein